MPDPDQLNDVLEALEEVGSPFKNTVLRERLGWEEVLCEEVKKRIAKRGLGLGDTVSVAHAEPVAQQAAAPWSGRTAKAPSSGTPKAKAHESWIYAAACTNRLCDVVDDALSRRTGRASKRSVQSIH